MNLRFAGTDGAPETRWITRLWKRIIAVCVCATIRFSSLRGSGMSAVRLVALLGPLPIRGRSWPCLAPSGASAIVVPALRRSASAS